MLLPTFATQRLFLRAVAEDDIPFYKKHFVNYEVIRYLASSVPWPYPDNGVEWFVVNDVLPNQGQGRWVWGIYLKSQPDQIIGVIDLWREGKPEHRGFWLAQPYWNQGLMTEAVEPVTEYAFTELGYDELVFANAKGNIGSRRVKEKTGAVYLRTEQASFVDPAFTEHELWLLTKEVWRRNRTD